MLNNQNSIQIRGIDSILSQFKFSSSHIDSDSKSDSKFTSREKQIILLGIMLGSLPEKQNFTNGRI
ncbi:hypothetical protein EBU91_04350 [bacterium]|nr:hypothetical protein [bacterium]